MKKWLVRIIITYLFSLSIVSCVYADVQSLNIGGDGRELYENFSGTPFQNISGFRISIYNMSGNKLGVSKDYTNYDIKEDNSYLNFQNDHSDKLSYRAGRSLVKYDQDHCKKGWQPEKTFNLASGEKYTLPTIVSERYDYKMKDYPKMGNELRLEGIKNMLTNAEVLRAFYINAGLTDDSFKTTQFKVVLEPIAIIKLYKYGASALDYTLGNGQDFAITPTELALLENQQIIKIFDKNRFERVTFPASLYLTIKDRVLNIDKGGAEVGSSIEPQMTIEKYGVAVATTEDPLKPQRATDSLIEREPTEQEMVFFTDIDVITSTRVYDNGRGFPYQNRYAGYGEDYRYDNETDRWEKIDYFCNEKYYCKVVWDSDEFTKEESLVIPPYGETFSYVKWHTPEEPCDIVIDVSCSDGASLEYDTFIIHVVDPLEWEKTPPNPKAKDRNDSFKLREDRKNIARTEKTDWIRYTCGGWISNKQEYKTNLDCGDIGCEIEHSDTFSGHGAGYTRPSHDCEIANCHRDECTNEHRWIEDWGEVRYYPHNHNAKTILGNNRVYPDDEIETNTSDTMKSGYGIKIELNAELEYTGNTSMSTPFQRALIYFPEFNYGTYFRIGNIKNIVDNSGKRKTTFEFYPNKYSTINGRLHFTPIWYPDSEYWVYVKMDYAFTPNSPPEGLSCEWSGKVNIKGNLLEDWGIVGKE